jgi:predicted transcriptional regulator
MGAKAPFLYEVNMNKDLQVIFQEASSLNHEIDKYLQMCNISSAFLVKKYGYSNLANKMKNNCLTGIYKEVYDKAKKNKLEKDISAGVYNWVMSIGRTILQFENHSKVENDIRSATEKRIEKKKRKR